MPCCAIPASISIYSSNGRQIMSIAALPGACFFWLAAPIRDSGRFLSGKALGVKGPKEFERRAKLSHDLS